MLTMSAAKLSMLWPGRGGGGGGAERERNDGW